MAVNHYLFHKFSKIGEAELTSRVSVFSGKILKRFGYGRCKFSYIYILNKHVFK